MESSLTMSAAAHRLWYLDGDVVKVRVSVTCVPQTVADPEREVVPLRAAPPHNYFSVDTSGGDQHEVDVWVRTLTATVEGVVAVDGAVMKPMIWPAASKANRTRSSGHPRASAAMAASAHGRVLYTLYSTGNQTLKEDMPLSRYECAALEFVFRLPEGCPSTFCGRAADYRHVVTVAATWQKTRSTASASAGLHSGKVEIPLLVFNSLASVAQMPLMALFPLPCESTLVREHFQFRAVALPSVPSSSLAAPLEDVVIPSDGQLRTSLTVRRHAKSALQNSLAVQQQPLAFMMPCSGVNVLQVRLRSSCVALGDFVRGSFSVLDNSLSSSSSGVQPASSSAAAVNRARRSKDLETPVPVHVRAFLELLECVTPEWAVVTDEESVSDTKAQGMENCVCVHKRVIEHAQFNVLDTPFVPFEFSLPVGLVPASTTTDITTFLWQLRVVVTAVPRRTLLQTAQPGVDMLGPLLEPVAGVFPLLVVPPTTPVRGRQGATWC